MSTCFDQIGVKLFFKVSETEFLWFWESQEILFVRKEKKLHGTDTDKLWLKPQMLKPDVHIKTFRRWKLKTLWRMIVYMFCGFLIFPVLWKKADLKTYIISKYWSWFWSKYLICCFCCFFGQASFWFLFQKNHCAAMTTPIMAVQRICFAGFLKELYESMMKERFVWPVLTTTASCQSTKHSMIHFGENAGAKLWSLAKNICWCCHIWAFFAGWIHSCICSKGVRVFLKLQDLGISEKPSHRHIISRKNSELGTLQWWLPNKADALRFVRVCPYFGLQCVYAWKPITTHCRQKKQWTWYTSMIAAQQSRCTSVCERLSLFRPTKCHCGFSNPQGHIVGRKNSELGTLQWWLPNKADALRFVRVCPYFGLQCVYVWKPTKTHCRQRKPVNLVHFNDGCPTKQMHFGLSGFVLISAYNVSLWVWKPTERHGRQMAAQQSRCTSVCERLSLFRPTMCLCVKTHNDTL